MPVPRPTVLLRLIGVLAALLLGSSVLVAPSAQAAAPAAPTAVTVERQTNNGPLVLWNLVTDGSVSQYVVERSWNNSGFGIVGTAPGTGLSYQDFTLPFTGSVTYRVKAVNSAGESSAYTSSAAYQIPAPALTPNRPIAVTATPSVTTGPAPLALTLTATAPAAPVGVNTVVEWGIDGESLVGNGLTSTYTLPRPGVYAVTLLVDRIAADGAYEYGSAQTLVTVTPAAPLPLAVAQDLRATSPRRGQVRLAWTNPAVSSATSLQVNRVNGTGRRSVQVTWPVSLTQSTFTDTTARSGVRYTYTLTASDGTATAFSNSAVITAR